MTDSSSSTQYSGNHPLEIGVLGGFRFWVKGKDALPNLPGGSQRLLAFLALCERPVMRAAAAGSLWPEASENHAHSSLRSAIFRLGLIAHEAIIVSAHKLRLADHVAVDIRESKALAHRLIKPGEPARDSDLNDDTIAALSADLLPDWYDDWAVVEAEDWRQLRLHALDALTERLMANRCYADATSAAMAAVKAEPFRETSHSALIRVHLAEGNRAEALAAFGRYRALLQRELELEPSPNVQALVENL